MTRHSKTRALEQDPDFCDWLHAKYHLASTISNNPNCYLIRDNHTGAWRLSETTSTSAGYYLLSTMYQGKVRTLLWHRVVYFLAHGHFPHQAINHRDKDKSNNNNPSNLEDVSYSANQQHALNSKPRHSSLFGVTANASSVNPWKATIRVSQTVHHIGSYPSEIAAAQAWDGYLTQHGLNRQLNF